MSDDFGPLFSPQQYDLLAIDKPEKQRKPRPDAALKKELGEAFPYAAERTLWQVARKLHESVGSTLAIRGLNALSSLDGWLQFVRLKEVNLLTLVTRIEQASAAEDAPREAVEIRAEMVRRQKYLDDTQQTIAQFLQEVHTAHPAMRKPIKQAMEIVIKAAFASVPSDPYKALPLAIKAVEVARRDTKRIENIKKNYRVPKDTAQWLVQIVARLAQEER